MPQTKLGYNPKIVAMLRPQYDETSTIDVADIIAAYDKLDPYFRAQDGAYKHKKAARILDDWIEFGFPPHD